MTSKIEKKVKFAEEQMSRLSEERKERESKRAREDKILTKELNSAKDLLKQYREKIEAIKKVVKELTTEMKAMKTDRMSNEQEKVGSLSIQVEQYLHQIEALKEENVAVRKELEKNENALNDGFRENKTLSDKYGILKSRLRKVLDGM